LLPWLHTDSSWGIGIGGEHPAGSVAAVVENTNDSNENVAILFGYRDVNRISFP
jgi:hypothetical protein